MSTESTTSAKPKTPEEIERSVAPRVSEAQALIVSDQSTLNAVGERLAINKELQKEAQCIFKPIKQAHDAAKQIILDQEKRVMGPLEQEEKILKLLAGNYLVEQKRLADAEEARLLRIRQEEEREAIRLAEAERKRKQDEINAQLQREHEEEQERLLNSLPAETPMEDIQAICEEPAPVVEIPLEVPVFAPVRPVARPTMPSGMSMSTKYKAVMDPALGEDAAVRLLCGAVAAGKVIPEAVKPNMVYLNKMASANRAAMNIPGVKSVPDTGLSQRSR